ALIVLVVFAFGGVIKSVFSSTCSKVATSSKSGTVSSCTN
ncbi:MAG: hypothetical protein JWO46_627, partial [Nocardioidaceae bacterium]|nr:hypothetical protein [Nocardioidaceae bacterium]